MSKLSKRKEREEDDADRQTKRDREGDDDNNSTNSNNTRITRSKSKQDSPSLTSHSTIDECIRRFGNRGRKTPLNTIAEENTTSKTLLATDPTIPITINPVGANVDNVDIPENFLIDRNRLESNINEEIDRANKVIVNLLLEKKNLEFEHYLSLVIGQFIHPRNAVIRPTFV